MKQIKEGCRVRVDVYKGDYYLRSYMGTVKGFTEGGLVKIDPEKYKGTKCVSADHIKVVSYPAESKSD